MSSPSDYIPELGQMLFSNGTIFATPTTSYVDSGIDLIAETVADGDARQNPAHNMGVEFANDVFQMRAYCWCEGTRKGHEERCPPNFVCGDFAVAWYKHSHRSASMSRDISLAEWWQIVRECVDSVIAERRDK